MKKRTWANLSKGQLCKDPQEEMSKGMKRSSLIGMECSNAEGAVRKMAR